VDLDALNCLNLESYRRGEIGSPRAEPRSAFLSYSSDDDRIAGIVKENLEKHGIRVVSYSSIKPEGEEIEKFIFEAILSTDVTVSIVSISSLISPWVGMEFITTFENEEKLASKKFFAVLLVDPKDLGLVKKVEKLIEDQILEIQKLKDSLKNGYSHLDKDIDRYRELKRNLNAIFDRIRNCRHIEFHKIGIQKSVETLLEYINKQ